MGSIISGIGGYQEGQFQSQMELVNAGLAGQASERALSTGSVMAGRIQTQTSQLLGQQRAGFAASGVDTGTGTPLDVMGSTKAMGSYDVSLAKANAAQAAWGYKMQGWEAQQQSKLDLMKGNNSFWSGMLGGASEGLGIGKSVFGAAAAVL